MPRTRIYARARDSEPDVICFICQVGWNERLAWFQNGLNPKQVDGLLGLTQFAAQSSPEGTSRTRHRAPTLELSTDRNCRQPYPRGVFP